MRRTEISALTGKRVEIPPDLVALRDRLVRGDPGLTFPKHRTINGRDEVWNGLYWEAA
jgi:hypothetical protein